jgi:uncharacterized Zn finger protein
MAYYDDYYGWKPYVSVAIRRQQAAREVAKLAKKGKQTSPVVIDGRKIARTFWGKAWCDNLERYSDYANRLPRGRTYVRNGSVVDLQIAPGAVTAMVSGSQLYRTEVKVSAVPKARWNAVCTDCSGAIDSMVELLQGRFSDGVMARLCQEQTGLFPSPAEITFTCSCPDWASMCKHVAAVLYGIGARLDEQPDLLFALRKVDQQDLITQAGKGLQQTKGPKAEKVLDADDLSEMFGIEMARVAKPRGAARPSKARTAGRMKPRASAGSGFSRTSTESVAPPKLKSSTSAMSATRRAAISKRMKEYWRARRSKK